MSKESIVEKQSFYEKLPALALDSLAKGVLIDGIATLVYSGLTSLVNRELTSSTKLFDLQLLKTIGAASTAFAIRTIGREELDHPYITGFAAGAIKKFITSDLHSLDKDSAANKLFVDMLVSGALSTVAYEIANDMPDANPMAVTYTIENADLFLSTFLKAQLLKAQPMPDLTTFAISNVVNLVVLGSIYGLYIPFMNWVSNNEASSIIPDMGWAKEWFNHTYDAIPDMSWSNSWFTPEQLNAEFSMNNNTDMGIIGNYVDSQPEL